MTARSLLSIALAMGLYLGAGMGITAFVPLLRSGARAVRFAWAFLLGVAWMGSGAYACSHVLHFTLGRKLFVALALLPMVFAGIRHWRNRKLGPKRAMSRPRVGAVPLVAFSFGLVLSSALFLEALSNPITDWDGRMTFGPQGRFLNAERTVDADVFRQERWWVAHPRYPLLMAIAQLPFLQLVPAADERVVRPLYATFYPVFLLLTYGILRRLVGRTPAALTTLAAMAIPFPAFFNHGGASGGTSDLSLACFWGAGLFLVARARTTTAGLAGGLLLAACLLTKNEGLPLAVLALLAALLYTFVCTLGLRPRPVGLALPLEAGRRLRPLLWATLIAGAAMALLIDWRSSIPNRWDEAYPALPNAAVLEETVHRFPTIVTEARKLTFDAKAWAGFWWVAPAMILIGGSMTRRRITIVPVAAILGALALYAIAYGASPWPAALIVQTTWNRFLVQMLLPWLVLLGLALSEVWRHAGAAGKRGESRPTGKEGAGALP